MATLCIGGGTAPTWRRLTWYLYTRREVHVLSFERALLQPRYVLRWEPADFTVEWWHHSLQVTHWLRDFNYGHQPHITIVGHIGDPQRFKTVNDLTVRRLRRAVHDLVALVPEAVAEFRQYRSGWGLSVVPSCSYWTLLSSLQAVASWMLDERITYTAFHCSLWFSPREANKAFLGGA